MSINAAISTTDGEVHTYEGTVRQVQTWARSFGVSVRYRKDDRGEYISDATIRSADIVLAEFKRNDLIRPRHRTALGTEGPNWVSPKERAALALADEFGTAVSEWTV